MKRQAILRALGARPQGRVLELGSGNGSNSRPLAERALRLDACEGTGRGCELTRAALADCRGARAHRLVLPGRFPGRTYDAVVIAELLYYLSPNQLRRLGLDVARALRPGGRLVLAHHQVAFDDAAQPPRGVQCRFLAATGCRWRPLVGRRCGRWRVVGLARLDGRGTEGPVQRL